MLFSKVVLRIYKRTTSKQLQTIMSSNTFNNQMSLYIPRCDTRSLPRYTNYASDAEYEQACKDFIAKQFRLQKIGLVERVDLVRKTNPQGYNYFIAFIHFSKWFEDHVAAQALQSSIAEDTKAKLQYNERWYWIVNENKNPRTTDQLRTEKMARLEETCARQAQQMAAMMEELNILSTQVATSVLPEEDQDGFQPQPRCRSPVKKRRIARPSPKEVTLADHVTSALEKLAVVEPEQYDLSFQPDVEAGIVQHPDDFTAVESAKANGHIATRKKLTVNTDFKEDGEVEIAEAV